MDLDARDSIAEKKRIFRLAEFAKSTRNGLRHNNIPLYDRALVGSEADIEGR